MARILAVDDSEPLRKYTVMTLVDAGHTVIEAAHGLEALAIARGDRSIDLVLTDLDMPRMDGLALVRELRRLPHLDAVPILIVTAEDGDEMKQRCLDAGANGFMQKPLREYQLLEAVRSVLQDG